MEQIINKRAHIECECTECKKTFMKAKSEITRNRLRDRKNFCSISCAMSYNNKLAPKGFIKDPSLMGKGTRIDEFTPFREILRRAKKRSKEKVKKVLDLTLNDLKEQWELQKGLCPYSGVKLLLPGYNSRGNYVYSASLDRINSDLGYIKGNIQFTSTCINFMKNNLTHEETLNVCKMISENYKNITL